MSGPAHLSRALVFLIGYRCTGKSAVAELLAARLAWDGVDADAMLERQANMTIRQIFERDGEAGFRQREAAVLNELCRRSNLVVATGGGVILSEQNRKRLKESGFCVWLTADAGSIWQRLQADVATAERRPNLTVGGRAEVEQLLRVREPLYRACADFTVDTVGRSPATVADEAFRRLTGR